MYHVLRAPYDRLPNLHHRSCNLSLRVLRSCFARSWHLHFIITFLSQYLHAVITGPTRRCQHVRWWAVLPPVLCLSSSCLRIEPLQRPNQISSTSFHTLRCFLLRPHQPLTAREAHSPFFIPPSSTREVPNVSTSLRAEFARGDGRVKRKEDDRRKRIQPSETLFVVNFPEQTTKRDDLRMLFEPFGELVRIEMKRNYAFVQFQNIEHAIQARDAVNGGKLDQSVLTVEFVAQHRGGGDRGDRRGGDRGDRRRDSRDRPGDYRRRSPPRDRHYYEKDYHRRSPPPRYRGGRSRSRSRSPPRYDRRSRSPRGRDYYDDRGGDRGGVRGGDRGGDRGRGDRSYRGSDRP